MWVGKKCCLKLNIVRSNYRVYPLVSNNVGIDFTELGPPHGSKPAQAAPKAQGTEKQDDLITIGFRVKPRENAIIHGLCKQDVQPVCRSQYIRTEENGGLSL